MADNRELLFRSAAYLRGRGVTYGSPFLPREATASKIYSIVMGLVSAPGVAGMDESLDIFADNSLDHACITPMIGGCLNPEKTVREVIRKLKVGGHLVIVFNVGQEHPGVAKLYPMDMEGWVSEAGKWICKERHEADGKCLLIYKRVAGKKGVEEWRRKNGKLRALVCRYGALGDAIVMTPLLRKLHEEGYEVTVNVNPYCLPALENNPYIHNTLVQEKDIIPNPLLGEYWKFWESRYDLYINLSESMEGDLLMVEGRGNFFTSKAWRHKVANQNYYDYCMVRGGFPETKGVKGELFFTTAENRRAKEFFQPLQGKFVMVWALNGSSHHKVYPLMEPTLLEWFRRHPDSLAITVGDQMARLLEFEHPQLITKSGVWSVRESLISVKHADLVVGPETMMTNAAGCYDTPKMVFLSHSTPENLTKYFSNCHNMIPEADCYPCHQLHYTKESCPIGEVADTATGEVLGRAPICSVGVSPQRVLDTLEEVYQRWSSTRTPKTLSSDAIEVAT